jgi:peptidyl-prolyl cis-trans isomerase D
MLTEIREKTHGIFAWGILTTIVVSFAIFGINNYSENGREPPIASVGDKDFFQRDLNKAYEQYAQGLRNLGVDEDFLKKQALQKLIRDEVLLQYTQTRKLTVTDDSVRDYIRELDYFKTDGQFDDKKYKSLLASQRISSAEFVSRVKNALVMELFERSVSKSGFATDYDLESFFKIQRQKRDADYLTVTLQTSKEPPKDDAIAAYYQQHQDAYEEPEQMAVEYIELQLADLASKVSVTDDNLAEYYKDQKAQFTTPERRTISHILFAINAKTDEKTALEKAQKAKLQLANKDFAALAAELSDDKLSAKAGGDLGAMYKDAIEKSYDKTFADAALSLKQGEVSEPVKSSFGYHLVKVTALVPEEIKSFASVKTELSKAYQKSQAEKGFYDASEKMADLSFQNPDSLKATAEALGLGIKTSALFTKDKGEGIAADGKIRGVAFTEEIQQGNNSTPIDLGGEKLVVLRLKEHKPAAPRELAAVKSDIAAILANEQAETFASEQAKQIKTRLLAGETMQKVADDLKLSLKSVPAMERNNASVPRPLVEAIFKAAKPIGDKASIFIAPLPTGEQVVVSLKKISEGVMSEADKKQMDVGKKSMGANFGQDEFNSLLDSLQADAEVTINTATAKKGE